MLGRPLAPRTFTTGRVPRGARVRPFGGLSPWPASSLSKPGARCRDCSRSASPSLSPNPVCPSAGTGLSAGPAVRLGQESRGWGSWGSTRSHGGSTRRQGHLGWSPGCGCGAGTAGQRREGCHRASLMIKRSEAAAAAQPGPAAPSRLTAPSFPQVTCLDQSRGPVMPPLSACDCGPGRPWLCSLHW
jgi:hypothetical protein